MGDLIHAQGDYKDLDISRRRKIFTILYRFSTKIKAKYFSIMAEKKNADNLQTLSHLIKSELSSLVLENLNFFQSFDEIVVYYDGGQKQLNRIIKEVFGQFSGFRLKSDFNKREKKLFQIADMLTTTDRLVYKYNKKLKFSKNEERFFNEKDIRKIIKETNQHRF